MTDKALIDALRRMAAAVVAANLPEYAVPGKIETMAALADAVAM